MNSTKRVCRICGCPCETKVTPLCKPGRLCVPVERIECPECNGAGEVCAPSHHSFDHICRTCMGTGIKGMDQ